MTFGSGSNGCLGHGNYEDNSSVSCSGTRYQHTCLACVFVCLCCFASLQPRIISSIIGYETLDVACGAHHVLALMSEGQVFAWGKGEGGKLTAAD